MIKHWGLAGMINTSICSRQWRTAIWPLLLVCALVFASPQSRALTSAEHSFDEMVALSELILVGTVSRIDSAWGQGHRADAIFSTVELSDIETIKGTAPGTRYNLKVIGGVVGDQAQFYPGLPQFETGQRYLLFIRGNERAMFPITGVSQGMYRVQWDADQARYIALPTHGGSGSLPLTRSLNMHSEPHQDGGRALQGLIQDIRASMARGR